MAHGCGPRPFRTHRASGFLAATCCGHRCDCTGRERADGGLQGRRLLPRTKLPVPRPRWPRRSDSFRKRKHRLLDLWIKSGRASWVAENFITDDTEAISADADAAVKAATADLARQAKRYEKLPLPPDVARKFKLLKLSVDIPAPRDPAAQAELAKIAVSLDSDYGKGTWCRGRQEGKLQGIAGH